MLVWLFQSTFLQPLIRFKHLNSFLSLKIETLSLQNENLLKIKKQTFQPLLACDDFSDTLPHYCIGCMLQPIKKNMKMKIINQF